MNNEENSKILYKIIAYDSDFIKEIPNKVRTIGGTLNYYYDYKKHRYLSQFVSDDFDIYDEFKRLIEENTHLQQENQQLEEKINKAIEFINIYTDGINLQAFNCLNLMYKIEEILKGGSHE